MQASRSTMTSSPRSPAFLEERLAFAVAAGIRRSASASTPGSVSARRRAQLRAAPTARRAVALGPPVLVGLSRKARSGGSSAIPRRRPGRSRPASRARRRGVRARRDDPPSPRRARARRGADVSARCVADHRAHGLEVLGPHGVARSERERERFLYDVQLEVGRRGPRDDGSTVVDYRRGRGTGQDVSESALTLIEALSSAVRTPSRAFPVGGRVRVRKPRVRARRDRPSSSRRATGLRAPVTLAYVGLGANLGDRRATLERRFELLARPRGRSPLRLDHPRDGPVGPHRSSRAS